MNTTEFTERMKGMASKFAQLTPEKQKEFLSFLANTSLSIEEKELAAILIEFQKILENIAIKELRTN